MTAEPGVLYFLDISGGRLVTVNPDGTDLHVVLADVAGHPDGVIIDAAAGHVYWTNMGNPSANDGSIERADLDGHNRTVVVAPGNTFTPKQIQLDSPNKKLYWCDREGMRVMRANLDGSHIETLIQTGHGDADRRDQRNWCVGVAVDSAEAKVYWTQKGADNARQGRIFRAGLQMPPGQTPTGRDDIELIYDALPEPIDLDIDDVHHMLYWTDRGDPPRGNTVNRAPLDSQSTSRPEPDTVFNHLMEGIGLALDVFGGRMFITDLAGSVYTAALDGTNRTTLLVAQGNLTGIAYTGADAT
jgi:DNA-binding beta-propeller fold protein YncE